MNLIKLLLSITIVQQISCEILEIKDSTLVIPLYISELIEKVNQKDLTRYNDVVLIRFETKFNNEIFNDVKGKILKRNPSNAVFTPGMLKPIQKYKVHPASFVIIVSDIFDPVSKKILNFYLLEQNFNFIRVCCIVWLREHFPKILCRTRQDISSF